MATGRRCLLAVAVLLVTVVLVHTDSMPPDLQMDQPILIQPGPSLIEDENYENRVKDYAARALEILTIRSRIKKVNGPAKLRQRYNRYRHRSRSLKPSTCSELYERMSDSHTMCLKDVGKAVRLSQTLKDAILKQHNLYRSRASPTAANMQMMVWDDSLAEVAGKWARQCRRGHDGGKDRGSPDLPGVHIGQNAAYGYRNWQTAIEAWHDEVSDFKYGQGSLNGAVVGHYTQIMAWRSARIGCGQADCPDSPYRRTLRLQLNNDTKTPYNKGNRCGECPNKCNQAGNMCDCGGKVCLNGGSINLNTCGCKCPVIYSGDHCQTLRCPVKDAWYCGSQWPKAYCGQFANVPHECPYLCGVCPPASPVTHAPTTCRLRCKNGGKVRLSTCECICPEGFTGTHCERKARLCDGKTCLNGGQLNTLTCLCTCSLGHTGDRCETKLEICEGKICKNRGRLNTSSCDCVCPKGYGGSLCQTKLPVCSGLECQNDGRLDEVACSCKCPDEYNGKRCEKRKCDEVKCHNGGRINYQDCTCICADGFEGKRCKKKVQPTNGPPACQKKCKNGGLFDPVTCRCWCPSPFVGELCQTVKCPQDDHKACENFPKTYCPDYFLMRHMCPYKCDLCIKQKDCNPDKWFCTQSYIKPELCRVVGSYCPSYCGLC